MKDLVQIGKILKTHGFKGHVKVAVDAAYMQDLKKLDAVFVEDLPYFIREKDINTDVQAILLLEDITTKELAQKLCGKALKVPASQLSEVYEAEYYGDLVGYTVHDTQHGELGKVIDIVEMPQQVLLQVMYDKRAVLIPLNEDLVPEIDDDKKIIQTNLPADFLDVF